MVATNLTMWTTKTIFSSPSLGAFFQMVLKHGIKLPWHTRKNQERQVYAATVIYTTTGWRDFAKISKDLLVPQVRVRMKIALDIFWRDRGTQLSPMASVEALLAICFDLTIITMNRPTQSPITFSRHVSYWVWCDYDKERCHVEKWQNQWKSICFDPFNAMKFWQIQIGMAKQFFGIPLR